jgi:hypothetical protein
VAALLCLATVLAYANSFLAVPQFDDYAVIVEEARVASLAAWWDSMPGIRPLLKLSYALNNSAGGLAGFHLANLLIHLGCVLLAWRVLARLLAPGHARAAALGALLFALHPVNTEAVTLLSGRSVSLATLGMLGSLLALYAGRRALSLGCFAAALAVRETAVVLPALAVLCLAWTGGWREGARPAHAALCEALRVTRWHWLLAIVGLALLLALPRFRELLGFSLALRDPLHNLVAQTGAWTWLLGQLLQPFALNADPRLPVFAGWDGRWLAYGGAWTLATLWSVTSVWRGRWPAFALLWFLVALAPTNSVLARLDVASGRHLYLAALPLYAALALLWERATPATSLPWARALPATRPWPGQMQLAAVLAGVLLAATVLRNRDYQSEAAFWSAVLARDDGNARAWNNLGFALERERPGDREAAREAYRRAIALDPRDYKARHNLARLGADGGT